MTVDVLRLIIRFAAYHPGIADKCEPKPPFPCRIRRVNPKARERRLLFSVARPDSLAIAAR